MARSVRSKRRLRNQRVKIDKLKVFEEKRLDEIIKKRDEHFENQSIDINELNIPEELRIISNNNNSNKMDTDDKPKSAALKKSNNNRSSSKSKNTDDMEQDEKEEEEEEEEDINMSVPKSKQQMKYKAFNKYQKAHIAKLNQKMKKIKRNVKPFV
ncbi:hypothetical protein DLAC_11395 [Tieghemostelium lacteum]|uniref:Uncharacterized protein n=1 Tax=Tieghemostelium lacteum TaxID=361077 RepID=A0A151Z2G8_TIELA|nr:hypothetical protein DLAC_11395 [Tieghemostelium lacteum]|eukprot:KYQ88145.1 hypothetical protein DLAC_11395 [Tieghemostelium lacteum]